jgi:hypothetical protein
VWYGFALKAETCVGGSSSVESLAALALQGTDLSNVNMGTTLEAQTPQPGQRYRHFKGGLYEVMLVAIHSENEEELVIYRDLRDGRFWARPLRMWSEQVEQDGFKGPRYQLETGDGGQGQDHKG